MSELFDVLDKNGRFTNKVATREECHKQGLWHRAIVTFIVSTDNKKVLLQLRSASKKLWPNLWDVSAGGHVLTGELGYQAGIREAKEELGFDIDRNDMEYIGGTTSENFSGDIINRHYNDYFVIHRDVDIKDIKIQTDELQEVKWFDRDDIAKRVKNGYDGITDKVECWDYLLKYFEITG